MYQNHTNINYILIYKFDIDVDYLNKLLTSKLNCFDYFQVEKNYQSLNSKLIVNPNYINLETYLDISDKISLVIANDIDIN